MERLLKDAEALTGVKYDINNLADVYSAIHAIQEQLGIAGTTMKEAETTITGSLGMVKASWQNLLTAMSGGGDLDRAINNFVYSFEKMSANLMPVIERTLIGIGSALQKTLPMLVQTVVVALVQQIPNIVVAVYNMIVGLFKGIVLGIKALFTGGTAKATEVIKGNVEVGAKSTEQMAENMEKTAEETKKAGKEAKKSLAAFDELNTLSSGASGGAGETPEASMPTISAGGGGGGGDILSTVGEINSTLAVIMGVVGGAMIAIGLLLLFTGNIAWGIGFIIFGGIIMGVTIGAVSGTNIDKETSSRIASITKIVGVSMVAIGLLLLFLGQIPWGLGFIAAGAGLVSVSEIFPTTSSEDIKSNCDAILSFLAGLTAYLVAQALLKNWATFVALWKDFRALMSLIHSEGFFKTITGLFGSSLGTMQLWAIAIGVVVGSIAYLALNWDKLAPAQRVITILSALAAAATAAAVAIALFHTSWSVGIAAAAIAGGIALLAGTYLFKNANGKKSLSGGGTAPADISQYAYLAEGGTYNLPHLAQGAVIPPNREFLAVLGDQKHGTNIEAPLDTIKQAVAEVLAQVNVGGGSFNGRIEVPVIIDGREVARAVREAENNMGSQTVFGGFANVY